MLKTTYLIMSACANICQAVLGGLARLADIRQAVLRGLAVLGGLSRLANTCQRPFLRKMRLASLNLRVAIA